MRLGLLADVHGNLPALEAALRLLDDEGVDAIACAGDLVGYGAFPNECVVRLTVAAETMVAGNHDLMAIGRLPSDELIALVRDSTEWTARELAEPTAAMLAGLPAIADAADGVVVAHGSLHSPETYVRDPRDAADQLALLHARDRGARVLVLGHTHEALAVSDRRGELLRGTAGMVALEPGERVVLNPGSVGQSRDDHVLARVAVLDLAADTVRFHELPYDVARYRAALRERGLPDTAYHLPPGGGGRARRAAGGFVRRARAAFAR